MKKKTETKERTTLQVFADWMASHVDDPANRNTKYEVSYSPTCMVIQLKRKK